MFVQSTCLDVTCLVLTQTLRAHSRLTTQLMLFVSWVAIISSQSVYSSLSLILWSVRTIRASHESSPLVSVFCHQICALDVLAHHSSISSIHLRGVFLVADCLQPSPAQHQCLEKPILLHPAKYLILPLHDCIQHCFFFVHHSSEVCIGSVVLLSHT